MAFVAYALGMGKRQMDVRTAIGACGDAESVPGIGMGGTETDLYPALLSLANRKGADRSREARKGFAKARQMGHSHIRKVNGHAVIAQGKAVTIGHRTGGPALGFHLADTDGELIGRERILRMGRYGKKEHEPQHRQESGGREMTFHAHCNKWFLHKGSIFLRKVAQREKNIVNLLANCSIIKYKHDEKNYHSGPGDAQHGTGMGKRARYTFQR